MRGSGGKPIFVLVCALILAAPGPALALPKGTKVETYQDNLNFPIDMAWVQGTKKIFFTEKGGAIRVMKGGRLLGRPCTRLNVNSQGERGALGITLHPHFKKNHRLYVYYTNASPLQNRVKRFTVVNNRCKKGHLIVRGIDASSSGYHNGGQLEFMKGKLFVSTGEAHHSERAQNVNNRQGKVLRYKGNGGIPSSNPFGRNPVWSYGHRNPFGLVHRPGTNKLYETENGPSCDDELNLIKPGRNYGWGANYDCGSGVGSNPKAPMKRWTPPIVPTDPTWYKGKLRALNGSLYMGDFGNGNLHRFVLNKRGNKVRKHRTIHNDSGIVDVAKGPGGWLYFLTQTSIKRIVRS